MGGTQQLAAGHEVGSTYRLTGVLARGGFGVVWAGRHLRTGQEIAIKVLDAKRAALRPDSIERFMREAQITAMLRHPNTVRVFDVSDEDADEIYLVMERLVGPTLEEVLTALYNADLTMSEATAIELAVPILGSLAEAHDAGLVHRDLKPGNIMLNEVPGGPPVVKVLDFGCTYVRGSKLTVEGNVFGTPGYMSPEQIVGQPIDARTDLFALGLILYRCVTGRAPFVAEENLALLYQYSAIDVPDPRSVCDHEVSKPLAEALLKALARDPAERFSDADQMRKALLNVRVAVRAAARRISGGRRTMISGSITPHPEGLASLARLATEGQPPSEWNRLKTESDVGGKTETYGAASTPAPHGTESRARYQPEPQPDAPPAPQPDSTPVAATTVQGTNRLWMAVAAVAVVGLAAVLVASFGGGNGGEIPVATAGGLPAATVATPAPSAEQAPPPTAPATTAPATTAPPATAPATTAPPATDPATATPPAAAPPAAAPPAAAPPAAAPPAAAPAPPKAAPPVVAAPKKTKPATVSPRTKRRRARAAKPPATPTAPVLKPKLLDD